jgi:predicted nucleotidyltransferase
MDRLSRADLRRLGVRAVGVFGSVARGEANAESDVDVLVDEARRIT